MKNKAMYGAIVLLGAIGLLAVDTVSAGVVLSGTRVIYREQDREITVKVNNPGKEPALVQAWADRGNVKSSPSSADAPFIILPPISRIDPDKGQSLRIAFVGQDQPKNKESIFWINVLDIPPMPKAGSEQRNYMQVAFRSRIKLFYRPTGLPGTPEEAAERLSWSIRPQAAGKGYLLHAVNASPYHVTVNRVLLPVAGRELESDSGMVPPGGSYDFVFKDLKSRPTSELKLRYESINDYGAAVVHQGLAGLEGSAVRAAPSVTTGLVSP